MKTLIQLNEAETSKIRAGLNDRRRGWAETPDSDDIVEAYDNLLEFLYRAKDIWVEVEDASKETE